MWRTVRFPIDHCFRGTDCRDTGVPTVPCHLSKRTHSPPFFNSTVLFVFPSRIDRQSASQVESSARLKTAEACLYYFDIISVALKTILLHCSLLLPQNSFVAFNFSETVRMHRIGSRVNPQMASPMACLAPTDPRKLFRIGLVLFDISSPDRAVAAISNPVSNCIITSLVVLNPDDSHPSNGDETNRGTDPEVPLPERESKSKAWLERCNIVNGDSVALEYGSEGFQHVLDSDVHALYIIVPTDQQREYVLPAIKAGKHVLLNDPESTSYDDFFEQLNDARQNNKLVQFSTMFVHHHRVKTFLDCVLYEKFGKIETINAMLSVNYSDLHKVGVTLPLEAGQGCIRRLGRFCVLISALMLTRLGSRPVSARVKAIEYSEAGQPVSADCAVHFTENRILNFHVSYDANSPTRQVLEVRSRDRYATMTDFVIPHPDGLATYRIYDKEMNKMTGKLEVVRGEALDVPSGPPQDVMMWRRFCDLCRNIDSLGWQNNPATAGARELANVALQTKRILSTLETCLQHGVSHKDSVPVHACSVE